MSAMCQTFQTFWHHKIVVRNAFQLDLCFPPMNMSVVLASVISSTDITVWIGPRLLSSRFEVVDERLPLGIAGGQLVLEYVSIDDMSELTMYSLPPVRIL